MLRNLSRTLLIAGVAWLAAIPALTAQSVSAGPVRGDVDGDGRVTAADARIVADFLVGRPVPAGVNVAQRGDLNGDGKVTSVDAAIIRAFAAGRDVSRFGVGAPVAVAPEGLIRLQCVAQVRARTVECVTPGAQLVSGARSDIIVGNQGVYVKLTSSNVVSAGNQFSFDVTLQNLLTQRMGTTDGTTPSPEGVRIFFHDGPNTTSGTGAVTVTSGSVGTFTSTGQEYHQYSGATLGADGILSQNEVSAPVNWVLQLDPGVITFAFQLYVNAPVQYPLGYVEAHKDTLAHPYPYFVPVDTVAADSLAENTTVQLSGINRTQVGNLDPRAIRWSSSNELVAKVDSLTGSVTGVADGTATITASSIVPATMSSPGGTRTGQATVVVSTASPATTTITAVPSSLPAGGTTVITVQLKNAAGQNVIHSGGLVELSTNTPAAVLSPVVDHHDGTYTATLSDTIAGVVTVSGTLHNAPIVDTENVTFTGATVHHFLVKATDGNDIPAQAVATPFNVKVTAIDQYGNVATGFTGKVNFSTTPPVPIAVGAGPSADFAAGVLASHVIRIDTVGDYTLTATRVGGTETGTSDTFQVQRAPTAVADGPTPTSVPGNPYHAFFSTAASPKTFTLPAVGVMSNDTRGYPLAMVTSFGGDSLGGTVTDHAAGSTVSPLPGLNRTTGSLKVNADGSIAFTPPDDFTGLYTFEYQIGNARGTSASVMVTIAVGERPSAVSETYPVNVLGNVPINTATSTQFKVSTNDAGDAKVVTFGTATNGAVVLNPDGTFTFTPAAGFTGGNASFTYTVKNGFGTVGPATVTIPVSGIAWFVDANAASNLDGRLGTPFKDLSSAFAASTKPLAGQPIFLYSSGTSYTGGVTLLGSQRLVGQGATGASFAAVMGVTWPADAGTQPSIGGGNANPSVTGGLTLGTGNTLQGFNLTNSGTLTGNTFGTLTLSQVGINTSGQALNLTTGTLSGAFTGVTSTGGTNNVSLSGVTFSGAFGLGSGALSGATGSALAVTNGTSASATDVLSYSGSITNATGAAANSAVLVSGGSTRLSLSGNVTQTGSGAAVSAAGGHTGVLTLTGSISATNGTGLQFDNADGSYDFTSAPAVTLNGGDAGVDVLNGSSGTFSFPSASQITNPTLEAIRINASAPTFSYPGRITKTNGTTGITVSSNTGGTINLGSRLKAITATGGNFAVNLTSNTGATISSADSLQVVSATGNGVNATGGGTLTVGGPQNTISSVGGIALNVTSTTIGGAGLNFRSISANGGSNGIVLTTTGSNAGLTVTGDGVTAASGGTIQNTSGSDGATAGNGVYLSSTRDVSLAFMSIHDHGNNGLYGSSLVNLTLNKVRFTGANGDNLSGPFSESAVKLDELTGSAAITGSYFSGGMSNNLRLSNTVGSLNRITLNSDTFAVQPGNPTTRLLNDALLIQGLGTATVNATVQSSTFQAAGGDLFQYDIGGSAVGDLVLNSTAFSNSHSNIASGGGGVVIDAGGGGTASMTYAITNNTFRDASGTALVVSKTSGTGTATGSITGNTIGVSGVDASGSKQGSGMDIGQVGGGKHTITITGNTIRQFTNFAGILFQVGNNSVANGGQGRIKATVQSNSISQLSSTVTSASIVTNGIHVQTGTNAGDNIIACMTIGGAGALANTLNGTGANGGTDVRLRALQSSTLLLPGFGGNVTLASDRNTFVQGNNAVAPTVSSVTGGSGVFAGGSCPF